MLSSIHLPLLSKPHTPSLLRHDRQTFKLKTRHRLRFSVNAIETNSFEPNYTNNPQQTQPTQQKQMRTLFPGGFKRPEFKVPSIILQLSSEEVLRRDGVLEYVDVAVSKWVRIVVLNGGNESGGKLYEAACLLKEVVRDRAYMVIAERVDIAAAVGASGVLLSDQGLPALVARNMMMESKSKSVILPLVARKVQSANAAISASDSEGADFLIYDVDEENYTEVLLSSVIQSIKVPVFITITLDGQDPSITEASKLLQAGASGLVISFDDMKISSDDRLSQLFPAGNLMSKRTRGEYPSSNNFDRDRGFHEKNRVSGIIKLEDKEKKFIETERMVLLEAISVVRRAAPLVIFLCPVIDGGGLTSYRCCFST